MSKVAVVYWSMTGNTEAMANLVSQGAKEAGAQVDLFTSAQFEGSQVAEYDAIAFGCPAMGAEQLEDGEFEPMYLGCEPYLAGKKVGLFGSYDWGNGEWMDSWKANVEATTATVVDTVIAHLTPDSDAETKCIELGKSLV